MAFHRRTLICGLPAALLVLGALAACQRAEAPAFNAVDITGAEYGRELELSDFDGRRRHLSDFKGKVTVVFFGFTQCPDVCPTTMLELAQVKKALGADGDKVQGVFVTIDPDRDTAAVLKAYVGNFSPDFIGLRGSAEETKAATRQFKVFYAKVPGRTDSSYTMDHTAGSYVFDAQGRIRLFSRYGGGAEALAHDLRLLIQQG
jgi:protein SCO1/2